MKSCIFQLVYGDDTQTTKVETYFLQNPYRKIKHACTAISEYCVIVDVC